MQTDWVRTVRRSGPEDTGERPGDVVAWMYLENVAVCLVEPRDDDELLTSLDSVETVEGGRTTSIVASGAPSSPCRGACAWSTSSDRTTPIGRSMYASLRATRPSSAWTRACDEVDRGGKLRP
jgi:hypothetical protein